MASIAEGRGRPGVHVEDALSPAPLALSVVASVVGTVLTARLGSDQLGTLAGAAISPMVAALFTTRRVGVTGRLRVMAVTALTLGALFITVVGFTVPEAATGESLIAERTATFVSPPVPSTGPQIIVPSEIPTSGSEQPSPGPTETTPTPPEPAHVHVVQPGDSLSSIADVVYGDPGLWTVIAEANNIADPDSISVGTELTIPPLPGSTEQP